jgi:hypothetical protein
MGILEKIFGKYSSSDSIEHEKDEQIPVTQYFFIGNEIQSEPLTEAMIILRQGPPKGEEIRGDNWEWSVVKCNEPIEAPPDTNAKICVYKEGDVINAKDTFQSNMAWILSPEEIEALKNEDEIIRSFPFPEEIRGETLPVGTRWGKKDLDSLLLSLKI